MTTTLAIACLGTAIVLFAISFFRKTLATDINTIFSSKKLLWLVLAGTVTFIIAELCIGLSIVEKNSTLAGLIETSYPIFIVLFSLLIFNENQVTPSTIIGGILIFAGLIVVALFQ